MPRQTKLIALLVAFLAPSVLIVSLQGDATDHIPPTDTILRQYSTGSVDHTVLGSGSPAIMNARCFVRGCLSLATRIGGERVETYNTVFQILFTWGALCFVFCAAAHLLPMGGAAAAVLLGALFIPWGFLQVGYSISWPYDLPQLFFCAVGIWAILSRRFVVLVIVMALGTLNKETVIFLAPAYLLAQGPALTRKQLLWRGGLLFAVFAVAYETPRMLLQTDHASLITASVHDGHVPRWQDNVQHLLLRGHATIFENIYWPLSLHLVPLLCFRLLPWSLRAMYLAAISFIIPIFFCGNIYELRLYNELIPLGAISSVLIFSLKLSESDRANPLASQ